MNKIMFLAALLVLSASAVESSEPPAKDAFYWNHKIGKGVNMGNLFEAPKEGTWGVKYDDQYFDLITKAGFDSVRLPVRWSAYALTNAPYTIDNTFLDRIDHVVRQALAKKLIIIVNMHHYDEIYDAPGEHKERFLAIWQQLARHYRDQPPELFLEPLNEPCKKLTAEIWNEYASETVKIIRKSNPSRIIVIGPVQWNSFEKLDTLKVPAGDRNIIATFHYYNPFQFTHQGAGWVGDQSKGWLGTKWTGSAEEKKQIQEDFNKVSAWSAANKIPVFMGEFGAYEKADMGSRAVWTAFVRSEAEKRKFSWAYWEFCSGFGIYDREAKEWRKPLRDALIPEKKQ